jgi:hypothetical protein
VRRLSDALAVALRTEGAQVRVDWRGPGFTRLGVTVADRRSVAVEVAHDARTREAVQLSFGRVLHPDEVAADKTLALFGRAAARDLVDVAALLGRYTLEQLCELATEKDAGFDRRVFADALAAAAAHSDAAFANSAWGGQLWPPYGRARLDGAPNCWMPWRCPPRTLCSPSADGRRRCRRLWARPALRDYLNVIGRRLPTPVGAHRCPAESAGSLLAGANWPLLLRLCYFRLSRPDTSWCTTCSQTGPSQSAQGGQIDIGGVGSCWHDRLLSSSLRNTF